MDKPLPDLSALHEISKSPIGQEFLSPAIPIKDFVSYHFTRFVSNLTSAFKDFRTSEIVDYEKRHKDALFHMIRNPLLKLDDVVVPIPKGMFTSYLKTLISLQMVLSDTFPQMIRTDLRRLQTALELGDTTSLEEGEVNKAVFDTGIKTIGSLYGKVGLTHTTAQHALVSPQEISRVKEALIFLTTTYYPQIIDMQKTLTEIEAAHDQHEWSESDKALLASSLMSMAYRLSLFALVMEHIQDMEHSFVLCLNILLDQK